MNTLIDKLIRANLEELKDASYSTSFKINTLDEWRRSIETWIEIAKTQSSKPEIKIERAQEKMRKIELCKLEIEKAEIASDRTTPQTQENVTPRDLQLTGVGLP